MDNINQSSYLRAKKWREFPWKLYPGTFTVLWEICTYSFLLLLSHCSLTTAADILTPQ